jgi:hypothetical protein
MEGGRLVLLRIASEAVMPPNNAFKIGRAMKRRAAQHER